MLYVCAFFTLFLDFTRFSLQFNCLASFVFHILLIVFVTMTGSFSHIKTTLSLNQITLFHIFYNFPVFSIFPLKITYRNCILHHLMLITLRIISKHVTAGRKNVQTCQSVTKIHSIQKGRKL